MSDNDNSLPAVSTASGSDSSRPRVWPLWVLFIVLLVGGLGLGVIAWDQHRQQQALTERYRQLSEQTSELRSTRESLISSRKERISRLESKLDKQRNRIETQARQIEHNARSLLGLGEHTRLDWLLAEAEYLLRLANQRLQLEKDRQGALRLLESADELLTKTDDAGVYPVRQQLAREILMLRSLKPVDRTGLYLELEAAMGMAAELGSDELYGTRLQANQTPQPEDTHEIRSWQQAWERVRDSLGRMVRIQRLDEPARAALSPEQNTQARLHLQLMFEQAAVALLRRDESAYRRALRRARDWLNQWYDPNDGRVETLHQLINEASGYRISVPMPDISKSLALLKARVEGRFNEDDSTGDSAGEPET